MDIIGIMQGRLSPPRTDRIQGFPWTSWEQEFEHAADIGYGAIEWLFEAEKFEENPIWNKSGRRRILERSFETGVATPSICADYFMEKPFFRVESEEAEHSSNTLVQLIDYSAEVGADCILLPVLEVAEIKSEQDADNLLRYLEKPLKRAEECGVDIGIETELRASEYAALVQKASSPRCGVYLDLGNATAKGYNVSSDIADYNDALCGIHIKDRVLGGPSVLLGTGDLDVEGVFGALSAVGYKRSCILQTAFTDKYLDIAKDNLKMVEQVLSSIKRD